MKHLISSFLAMFQAPASVPAGGPQATAFECVCLAW